MAAIGGSTNAVVHLLAIAGRIGVKLTLDDFDRLARELPCLVNLMPSGKYLMEDFCYAGGLPAVMNEIACRCCTGDAITVNGRTVRENVADAQNWNPKVIKPMAEPFKAEGRDCRAARQPRSARRRHQAVRGDADTDGAHAAARWCSRDSDDFHDRIDDEHSTSTRTCVMVLKGCGPIGYPGMPESRQHAAAAQGPAQGHHRHGAHQRRRA